ncbi:MAG: HAD family hydrolase [Thermoplasmata archaeon]|nr:HAD family hydrolase [Thermoplasmata archaeon]
MPRPPAEATTSSPRVVLFDMDDTLFDHTFALRQALVATWRRDAGLRRRPLHAVVDEYARLLDDIHPDVLRGLRTHAEARAERFRRLFEWADSPRTAEEIAGLSAAYRATYQSSRRTVPGAMPLLRALRGRATVGIVTNNHTVEQREKLEATGLAPWIDFLLTSEDAGFEKPDPAIFRMALERAGAAPVDAVMVGDRWEADVVGARAAGIRPVWYNPTGRARPEPGTDVVEIRSFRPVRALAPRLLAPGSDPAVGGGSSSPGL